MGESSDKDTENVRGLSFWLKKVADAAGDARKHLDDPEHESWDRLRKALNGEKAVLDQWNKKP